MRRVPPRPIARLARWAGVLVAVGAPNAPAAAADAAPSPAACAPSVRLEGAPDATERLAEALGRAGLQAPAPGCPATTVKVAAHRDGWVLDIVDVFGRATRRSVRTIAGASAVIESRTRTDLTALLPDSPPTAPAVTRREPPPRDPGERRAAPAPAAVEPPPAPPGTSPAATLAAASAVPDAAWTSRFHVAAAIESSVSSDGSPWFGVALSAGVALGPVCLGPVLRIRNTLAEDSPPVRVNEALPARVQRRQDTDLALAFELPFRTGSLQLRPGVELGVGGFDRGAQDTVPVDPNVKLASGRVIAPGPFEDPRGPTPRAGAQLAASWRLWHRWHVQASVGLGFSLFADATTTTPNGTVLPGTPRAIARTSLGLRYGGR